MRKFEESCTIPRRRSSSSLYMSLRTDNVKEKESYSIRRFDDSQLLIYTTEEESISMILPFDDETALLASVSYR